MIEVFVTDIQDKIQAERVLRAFQSENAYLKINVDLNETGFSFPCGHSILRVEGSKINADKFIAIVKSQGFKCQVLEDKICT
jgi:hypothetical protein